MKLKSFVACLLILGRVSLGAQNLEQIDELWETRDHARGETLIDEALKNAGGGAILAELYWRQARLYMGIGDALEDEGAGEDDILALYLRGEASAQAAIDADNGNHNGYYWKSSNLGRAGQIRGVLKSLAAAKPMRELLEQAVGLEEGHPDSYYVMGQLYRELPGGISFGDKDLAVSLGRWAIMLMEREFQSGERPDINYDFYTELAKSLHARGNSDKKRAKTQAKVKSKHESAGSTLERAFYYEGTVELPTGPDQSEAEALIEWTLDKLKAIKAPTPKNRDDLQEIDEVLVEWKG